MVWRSSHRRNAQVDEAALPQAARTVHGCMTSLGEINGVAVPFLPVAISAGPSWGEMAPYEIAGAAEKQPSG